jgi:hypothetical protein
MRDIQNRIRQAISKKPIAENELELVQPTMGRTSVHAGPGFYLYDIRTKTTSSAPVHSIADSIKESLKRLTDGDFEFFYFNAVVYKDENDMYSQVMVNNQKIGPFTLEQLHNYACDICYKAYTNMARRAASYKNHGPVDNNTLDGQARTVNPTGIRMEGKASSKKKDLVPTKKLRKMSALITKK